DGDTVDLQVDLGAAGPEGDGRRPAQHLFHRVAPDRFVGSVSVDLPRIGDKRLQSGGQRVLGRIASCERDYEEEDLELVGGYRQLFAGLIGDDSRGQRAPDVVDRVAPLLFGEFECIRKDVGEELELVLLAQRRLGRVDREDAVERVEDSRPIFLGYTDG